MQCGPEAARKLRELGYKKLFIGVTGNAMDLDVLEYERAGADIILTKPMRMDALNKVIEFCNANGCISHYGTSLAEVITIEINLPVFFLSLPLQVSCTCDQ